MNRAKLSDSGYLALWLTSLLGVLVGLCFVWGSTDVSLAGLCVSPEAI